MTTTEKLERIAAKCRELLNRPKAGGQSAAAGWRSTISAIELIKVIGAWSHAAESSIDQILAAWPDELL